MKSFHAVLDLFATILTVLMAGAALWAMFGVSHVGSAHEANRKNGPVTVIAAQNVSIDGAKVKGNRSAPAAIIEYSDFQCPYCASFATKILPELSSQLLSTGKALLVFRNLPLQQVHAQARLAALAGECADKAGKFWEFHDRLFVDPNRLAAGEPFISGVLSGIGIDTQAWITCQMDPSLAARVRADEKSGQAAGILGTPTFLIGVVIDAHSVVVTRRISGAQSVAVFAKAIADVEDDAAVHK
jgi:protein-disulfide isomerase